ncbi:MAG TPA: class I SAM-dependent DNA methyltransferase [Nitrososphaeraceae archaeon]|nr:class I SAM-dependent DNA methyltransferase [Nitrososphaeraceae archaeon]
MSSQSLESIIKSCRDLMRKDAGLNTDVDRIPQIAWILFLKCFDDFEKKRVAIDKNYNEAIPAPFRWRDWAADENKGKTGSDLINFVNNELFPKIAGLVGGKGYEQRDVIASIFKELNNRLLSGYILREIINLINKLNFTSTDDIHTMARIYERLLLEMRDAAGTSGEFYTPRPIIRFIVHMVKPSLTRLEKVLDPACGTGGFLTESLEYMKKEEKSIVDYDNLRYNTIYGIEKKPMPYLLGMMNMLLHEVDRPNIVRMNTLTIPLKDITEERQFDIIMTNPPFGGEEESRVSKNLPVGMQTTDTALAFLLFIIETLRHSGRAALILPNGPLFAGGIAAKIREKLLVDCNLHTIIRLPESVFSPYTGIATNILFFDKNGPTNEIWYYQMKVRNGLKAYNKTNPIMYNDFADVIEWWNSRVQNQNAWKVNITELRGYNLDLRNPNDFKNSVALSPHAIIDDIIRDEENSFALLKEIKEIIQNEIPN